jgi:hypothetical protein
MSPPSCPKNSPKDVKTVLSGSPFFEIQHEVSIVFGNLIDWDAETRFTSLLTKDCRFPFLLREFPF